MTWWEVVPRYTPGSPALVSEAQALRVAAQEKEAHATVLSGVYGPEKVRDAEQRGLQGVVWSWHEAYNHIYWRDEITGEQGNFKVLRGSNGIRWPWRNR